MLKVIYNSVMLIETLYKLANPSDACRLIHQWDTSLLLLGIPLLIWAWAPIGWRSQTVGRGSTSWGGDSLPVTAISSYETGLRLDEYVRCVGSI